mmetsp:Transcript_11009/g.19894  ORF Transcript_11009/g.19894 Transcript_11009/m.19894 type:complete len:220 (-) Transcript_11009:555-1214(-)
MDILEDIFNGSATVPTMSNVGELPDLGGDEFDLMEGCMASIEPSELESSVDDQIPESLMIPVEDQSPVAVPSEHESHSYVTDITNPKSLGVKGSLNKNRKGATLKQNVKVGVKREAEEIPEGEIGDLKGTTAMQARRMTDEERQMVLLKRKLRNRESAKRSRTKRQNALTDLNKEFFDLLSKSEHLKAEVDKLSSENERLARENARILAQVKVAEARAI